MIEDNNFPLVSVVIIGKNERDTIERCLLSIFNQSYPNFEIMYVDDKSSDNTLEKADQLKNILLSKKNCKRFLTLSVETNFPSKNRNIGIKVSHGSILAFMDGDCIAEPDWLANLVEQFSTEVGIVGGPINLAHWKKSIRTKAIDMVLASYLGSGGSALFYQIKRDREVFDIPSGNMAVRKHLLEKLGGFDEKLRYNEDNYLCYRVRNEGYRIIYASKARIYHFIGIDSYADFVSYFKRYGYERGKNTAKSSKFLTPFNLFSFALIVFAFSLLMLAFLGILAPIALLYLFLAVILVELTASFKLAVANNSIKLLLLLLGFFITLHNIYNIAFLFGYLAGLRHAVIRKNEHKTAIAKGES
jgi:glycosyltransferase involved in cell wall biosynthesis